MPYGIQDITGIPGSERALVLSAGFNPFASLPSIHVLWACLTGFGLWAGAPRSAPRWTTSAFPLAVTLAVVLTGNHYILDCVASFLLFSCFLVVYWATTRARGSMAAASPTPPSAAQAIAWASLVRRPSLLAGLVGVLLSCANAGAERLPGIAAVLAASVAVALANRNRGGGAYPHRCAPLFDWYAGLLLVAGATTAVTGDGYARLAGSALWLMAAALPFCGRLPFPSLGNWAWTRGARRYAGLGVQRI